jgi:NAD(P)-dependent dehydrogenase (short-subunit alcohol dehydrogenase family)
MRLDVTDPSAWATASAACATEIGPPDILCSNAGVAGAGKPVVDLPADDMRWVLEVNVMGALRGVQALAPGMRTRGRGCILFTVSMAGLMTPPKLADYAASKHALIALAESLRSELANEGVHVAVLCPAAVTTNLAATTRRARGASRAIAEEDPDGDAGSEGRGYHEVRRLHHQRRGRQARSGRPAARRLLRLHASARRGATARAWA